ncbi:UDP-glucose 4-epimerase GalE [Bradyrhizobium sp. HKCCYLR20261]|uniref:UDP-glucose 4-epimerase GalE n=1 Tax=Bradyrhizobium sp. HKCCYLR20261 TaxID=3420760 RepID=UPI003EB7965F
MSILVTGGAGYIGSHVVCELAAADHQIVVLDNLSSGVRANVPPEVTFIAGECGDQSLVGSVLDEHDVTAIIHLAGSAVVSDSINDPGSFYANNTVAARNLIEIAAQRGVAHFVICSSAAVYGDAGPGPLSEAVPPQPISPYGRSMLMSEMILQDVAAASGVRYVILRAFNVAGSATIDEHRVARASPSTSVERAVAVALGQQAALDVHSATLHTHDGTPIRDYIHILDLAGAHIAALRYLRDGGDSRIFNCGSGHGHSVLDVVRAIQAHCGASLPLRRVPPRPGDPAVLIADTTRIRRELGWQPAFDDIGSLVSHALTAAYRREKAPQITRPLVRLVAESGVPAATLKTLIARFATSPRSPSADLPASRLADDADQAPAPPRASGTRKTLTIGMATYDDYDGVYFTLQAMRLYHPEILSDVEFIIVDNNPGGLCGAALRQLAAAIPDCRYLPQGHIKATTIKDWVFRQAQGKYVLCVDCHILVAPGALKRLIDYFDADPETKDLLHGPLIYDDLEGYATHFKPEWRGGMYGVWDSDPAGAHADLPPFEIPMQGMGLFACRREAWAGFSAEFRGFGGEEGYIHEKFRQRGGKVLCLPFLRWVHRFNRPFGLPYPNVWADRVRNYLIGFREVGWDTRPVVDHFKKLLGEQVWASVSEAIGPGLLHDEAPSAMDLNPTAKQAMAADDNQLPRIA